MATSRFHLPIDHSLRNGFDARNDRTMSRKSRDGRSFAMIKFDRIRFRRRTILKEFVKMRNFRDRRFRDSSRSNDVDRENFRWFGDDVSLIRDLITYQRSREDRSIITTMMIGIERIRG